MNNKRLIILCGLPFSGKTSFAKKIVEKLGGQVVSQDEVFSALWRKEKGNIEIGNEGPAIWSRAYKESLKEAGEALKFNDLVIWDHTNLTRKERQEALAIANKAGASAEIIFLNASLEEIRIRREANKKVKNRNDIPDWLLRDRVNEMEAPSSLEMKVEEIKAPEELEAYLNAYDEK